MKPATLKSFLDVHTWTGLGTGLVLFVAFYAGALTVFWEELDVWDHYLDMPAHHQDYQQAQQLFDLALEAQPNAAETVRLDLSRPSKPAHLVRWFERLEDGSFEGHEFRLDNDGALSTVRDQALLSDFIYRLHYTAGLPASFGLYVLGLVCVIYGLALVTGLLIFLPNFFRDLFIVRPGRNKKRFWLDTHNVIGVLSLPWHVMFAWSSALLAIGFFVLAPFEYLVYDGKLQNLVGRDLGLTEHIEPAGEMLAPLSVADILELARDEIPALVPHQLRYEHVGDVNAVVTVRGMSEADTLAPFASVTLNAGTGQVLAVNDPAQASAGATFYNGLISLHYASFGGYVTRWLYFVLGLAGAFLFYSGNLLWIESRRKRRSTEQTRGTVFMARLNSGVCIGCMAGISSAFLASRLLVDVSNRAEMTEYVYFSVFFLSIGWCYLRPVATGTRDLLYLAALLSAAIPLVDLMLVDVPDWSSALVNHGALLSVDVLAVTAAVAFWRMGAAVQRRAMRGDPNSVWAAAGGKTQRPERIDSPCA
tara:strand:+ start:178 stop:1779 length:1602 start_codon:yes stop_codon:yes gene_type:complete